MVQCRAWVFWKEILPANCSRQAAVSTGLFSNCAGLRSQWGIYVVGGEK